MRLPRDTSGRQLVRAPAALGDEVTRQSGSHLRLTTMQNGQHHITVPAHDPLKLGMLRGIIDAVARHHGLRLEEVVALLG